MQRTALTAVAIAALTVTACKDETISGFADRKDNWVLQELDREPFDAVATISFPEPGRIFGQAPCNRYSSEQKAPYPWFEIGPVAATRMACDALPLEQAFFDALGQMRQIEVLDDTLIMSNDAGRQMVFRVQN
ncbi:META domain-containing protein [uncultured Aliiroseovarius sp.]|uniref:META domain-containing protein n=1 Tax=uncultured Aliiroseovarius sp. TaxID=1658783 RepID=UPI002609388A|nr:META domain-containing protein [uncultured Aliiroseovarius sp.]